MLGAIRNARSQISYLGGITNGILRQSSITSKPSEVRDLLPQTEMPNALYLDNMATTPMDPRVLDAMLPFMTERMGNPHSSTHVHGYDAANAVERARSQIAKLINAKPSEIIFTSGATESNNLAVKGACRALRESQPQKKVVITSPIEHKCVLASAESLEKEGFEHVELNVDHHGRIDMNQLEDLLSTRGNEIAIVSIMMVNNEIGTVQDVEKIGDLCQKHKVYFHTDAAQAVGKMNVDVSKIKAQLISISGHKIYGPKGVGALYVSKTIKPRIRLEPIISGGGQERGLRSGTLATPLCVGIGAAAEIAMECLPDDEQRIRGLAERFIKKITSSLDHVELNGDPEYRNPGSVNLSFEWVEGESLLLALSDIAISTGSACTSASLEPSYVLAACGHPPELAHTSLRFGIGRFTSEAEIDYTAEKVISSVKKLRDVSPLYEMWKEGIDLSSIQWKEDHH